MKAVYRAAKLPVDKNDGGNTSHTKFAVLLVLGGQHLRWQLSVEAGVGDASGFDDLGDGLILLVLRNGGVDALDLIRLSI